MEETSLAVFFDFVLDSVIPCSMHIKMRREMNYPGSGPKTTGRAKILARDKVDSDDF